MHHLVEMFGQMPAYSVRANVDLTIDAWNRAARHAFGWSANEAIGVPACQLLRRANANPDRRDVRAANLHRRGWWAGSTTLLDRDGDPLTFEGMCWSVLHRGERHFVTVLELLPQIAPFHRPPWPPVAGVAVTPMGAVVEGWPTMMVSDTDLRQTVAANIRLARQLAGFSQPELADAINIRDVKEISRYEHARRSPGGRRLAMIAAALGQPVSWFFDDHEGD